MHKDAYASMHAVIACTIEYTDALRTHVYYMHTCNHVNTQATTHARDALTHVNMHARKQTCTHARISLVLKSEIRFGNQTF